MIKENNIKLDLIGCKKYPEKEILFHPISNVELDLKRGGITSFCNLISEQYDELKEGVPLFEEHQIVFDLIEKICKNEKGETIESFVDIGPLLKSLKEGKLKDLSKNVLKNILNDLNKMGLIIYLDNPLMNKTIIGNPEWLNRVFINIIDFGRRKAEEIIEKVNDFLCNINNYKFQKTKENCKEFCSSYLKEIRSNSNPKMKISEIWKNPEEREKSKLDKTSFQNLLVKLEMIERKLIEEDNEGTEEILKEINGENENISLSKSFYHINREELFGILNTILDGKDFLDKQKREFLINLLIKFDFILPQKKIEFESIFIYFYYFNFHYFNFHYFLILLFKFHYFNQFHYSISFH